MPLPADLGFGVKLPSATFNAVKNAIKTWVEAVNGGGYRLSNVSSVQIAPGTLPGSPAAGEIAIDSDDSNKLKFHNGTSWVTPGAGGSSITRHVQVSTPGAVTSVTLSSAPIDQAHVSVHVGGVFQVPGDAWTLSGSDIDFTYTLDASDRVTVEWWN